MKTRQCISPVCKEAAAKDDYRCPKHAKLKAESRNISFTFAKCTSCGNMVSLVEQEAGHTKCVRCRKEDEA